MLTDEQLLSINGDENGAIIAAPDAELIEFANAIEAAVLAEQAKTSADISEAYDLIDRQLRNTLDDSDYAEYSAALDLLYRPAAPAPEGIVMVPERIKKVESGFRGMFLKEAQAYKRGWNDCRASVIAAAGGAGK